MTAGSGAVLVVDDDKMNRIMLSKLLENEGYRPTAVVDGEAALAAVADKHFDLVLLDVMMPGVDGIEVLRSLKADSRWRDIPVIMISAVEDTASIARCIELGAEDYLLRPFDPVLVRSRVSACLARDREADTGGQTPLGTHRADVVVVTVAASSGSAAMADAVHAILAGLVQEAKATVVSTAADGLTVVFDDPAPSSDGPARAQRFATRAGEELATLVGQGRASGVEVTHRILIAPGARGLRPNAAAAPWDRSVTGSGTRSS